jgi:hypothetical protein
MPFIHANNPKGGAMEKDKAIERLYDIKSFMDYLPRFRGRAKLIEQVLCMIRFTKSHVADEDLNQKFVAQAEHIMQRANAIVDQMNNGKDQQQKELTY